MHGCLRGTSNSCDSTGRNNIKDCLRPILKTLMNSQTDEDLSIGGLHSCSKCKQTFADVDQFFNHKNTDCVPNDDSIKISGCYGVMVSGECTQTQREPLGDEREDLADNVLNFDTPASTSSQSPVVQTVLLTRGLPPSSDQSASSVSDSKGQTVHFVVLPGHHCQHCLQMFSTESDLNEHSQLCTRRISADVEGDKNFMCAQCNRSFKSATILKKHMATHSDEKPFHCLYQGCTYSSRTKGSLVRHERRHTDSRPFTCDMCHRSFRESGALLRHKKSRMPCSQKRDVELPNYRRNLPLPGQPLNPPTDDDPLESHLLSAEFLVPELSTGKDSLLLGESTKDPELLESKESSLLDSPSKGSELLGEHLKDSLMLEDRHIVDKDQQTVDVVTTHNTQHNMECGGNSSLTTDNTIEGTEATRLTHQPVSVSEYFTTCQMCGSQCSSKDELKEHLKEHLTSGSFLCDQCSFIGSRQEFTAHITHIHSGPDTANSEFMASEWVYMNKSLAPIRTVSPQQAVREAIQIIQQLLIIDNSSADETLSQLKDKVLTLKNIKNCPVCDKEFRSPSYLRHHIRVHTGERPYKCKLCPKDFPTKDTFKKHMHCHSNERSFKCGECGKLFKRITHAKEHLKIHSNDRPYTCSICKKSFKTATIFKVHERTHSMHMPWVCKICNKRFREKASLTRHVRVHTGDKPFKCKYCDKEFAEHGTLSRHLRAKAPCSAALAEARRPLLKAYPSEEQLQTIVITEDGDIACPTVLTEFSAVVTDTQQYMPPQTQLSESIGAQSIDTTPLDGMEVDGEHGYHIIVNEQPELTYNVDHTQTEQQESQVGREDACTGQSSGTQYVYLDNLDDGSHSLTLPDQAASDQVMLITNC